MNVKILCFLLFTIESVFCQPVTGDKLKELNQKYIQEVLINSDTVLSGQGVMGVIDEAILHSDSLFAHYIGINNKLENYELDSSFSEITWIERFKGELTSFSRRFDDLDRNMGTNEKYVSSFRISYRVKNGQFKRHFGVYISFYANRKPLHIQGMIKVSEERKPISILTKEELIAKLKKHRGDRKLRKYLKENISKLEVVNTIAPILGGIYSNIYYEIFLIDYKEPGRYRFDPWTGELCCVIKGK